jgi:hypothetical protein
MQYDKIKNHKNHLQKTFSVTNISQMFKYLEVKNDFPQNNIFKSKLHQIYFRKSLYLLERAAVEKKAF